MMEEFWLTVITNRQNPLFWPILFLLWVASLFYRCGLKWRERTFENPIKLDIPVISVGNLTVGGTGKTPVLIEIARYFISIKKTVGIVSSGYKRAVRTEYAGRGKEIVSIHFNGLGIDYVGDEVYMMAQLLPEAIFSVGESKTEAAQRLSEEYQVDVVLIDDGFQHRRLFRDHDLLVVNAVNDIRREKLFPFGRLREKLQAAARADSTIITRTNYGKSDYRRFLRELFSDKHISEVEFTNDKLYSDDDYCEFDGLADKKIYFFSGIGDFKSLLGHITNNLFKPVLYHQFRDHCRYNRGDRVKIKRDISRCRPDYLVTTFKDYVKLRAVDFGRPLYYLGLYLNFSAGEKELFEELRKIVER